MLKNKPENEYRIITGGTNTGVMKLVGEAVADELHKYNTHLTVLGIATWGIIKDKDVLINPVRAILKLFLN